MSGHDLDGVLAHIEHAWPADQRDVVEMNHVRIHGVEQLAKGFGLEPRPAGDLRRQWRQQAERAFQPMDVESLGRRVGAQGMRTANCLEAITAMNDVDFMSPSQESTRETIDVSGVTAKAMSAEECRDHAEFQRRPPVAPLSKISEASRVLPDQPVCGKPDCRSQRLTS
jgi:hypothetical protein